MPAPPSLQKVNPADQAMLLLWLNSKTVARSTIDEYAETLMAPTISMVNGVAQVSVMGAQKFAVRVQVDPERLRLWTFARAAADPRDDWTNTRWIDIAKALSP